MALTQGQPLQNGKYTIERELGRGRVGITYLARRIDGMRRVIKILNPDMLATLSVAEQERLEMMFWQEAVKLAKCSGTAHIVQMDTPFKEGMVTCLPMEYMDGNSLADRGQQKLPEKIALEYVRQIGEALAIVHQQNLVHCDIRPANIFLRRQDSNADAVLTGFRLALDFDTELSRTRVKERMDGFSPIELYARGQAVGAYTDVYSLAATLYELLTGEIPVSAKDRKLNGSELISSRAKNPEISTKTNKAILEGMKLMPEQRPQSVDVWLEKLNVVKTPLLPKKPINWQTLWMAAAVIVSLLMGIPAWLALSKPDTATTPSTKSSVQVSPK